MQQIILIVGAVLPLVSSWVYIASILRGHTKPQRTTRFLMALITGMSFFALLAAGDMSGMWLALTSFVQSLVIFCLALRWGIGGRNWLDVVCIVLCVTGIVAWLRADEPVVGLVAAIVADFIAIIPALVKTWRLPHTETVWFFVLDGLAGLLIIVAGPHDAFSLAYPAYILLANAIFVVAILRPRGPDIVGCLHRVKSIIRYQCRQNDHSDSR